MTMTWVVGLADVDNYAIKSNSLSISKKWYVFGQPGVESNCLALKQEREAQFVHVAQSPEPEHNSYGLLLVE